MHNSLHTATPAPAEQGRVTEGSSGQPACVCVLGRERGSHQAADGWVLLQLLENQVTAQPRRAFTTPTGRGGGGFHLEKGGPGGALHLGVRMTRSRWAGSCIPRRDRGDPALEAQGSTRAQEDFKSGTEVGGKTFPCLGLSPKQQC